MTLLKQLNVLQNVTGQYVKIHSIQPKNKHAV